MTFNPKKFHIDNLRHKTIKAPSRVRAHANVELIGFDADIIKTYADFVKLRQMANMRDSVAYLKFLDIYRNAIVHYERTDNKVVSDGSSWLANIVTNSGLGGGQSYWNYVRVGTSGTAVSDGDSDVLAVTGTGAAVSRAWPVANVANWDFFFTSTMNNATWQETALASQAGAPDLTHPIFARKVLTSFVKDSSKTATITWSITFTPV